MQHDRNQGFGDNPPGHSQRPGVRRLRAEVGVAQQVRHHRVVRLFDALEKLLELGLPVGGCLHLLQDVAARCAGVLAHERHAQLDEDETEDVLRQLRELVCTRLLYGRKLAECVLAQLSDPACMHAADERSKQRGVPPHVQARTIERALGAACGSEHTQLAKSNHRSTNGAGRLSIHASPCRALAPSAVMHTHRSLILFLAASKSREDRSLNLFPQSCWKVSREATALFMAS
jgi:hypothetical protein